jgi:hypothetical protein
VDLPFRDIAQRGIPNEGAKALMDTTRERMGHIGEMQNQDRGRMSDMASKVTEQVSDFAGRYSDTEPKSTPRSEHREGSIARAIEQQTAKLPSDAFLWAAVGSMGLSLALEIMGEEKKANFVGHWAPTLLIFGLYNKMVKLHGSDGV